jgi:hypothetical protein
MEGLATEAVGIFCGHLVNFLNIWYILWPSGIFFGHLVYVTPFWYVVPRKLWQPYYQAWLNHCIPSCLHLQRWLKGGLCFIQSMDCFGTLLRSKFLEWRSCTYFCYEILGFGAKRQSWEPIFYFQGHRFAGKSFDQVFVKIRSVHKTEKSA